MAETPSVIVIGGPNGAGKTTISRAVVEETLGVGEFVNADAIALGLSGFSPERAAMQAGRVMLARLRELAAVRTSFAFEATLASRTFAPWIAGLVASGYEFNLAFVWLRTPELAIRRVRKRVRQGGHSIPPDVVQRRYARGVANFVRLYAPMASRWKVYDNSVGARPSVVAFKRPNQPPIVLRPDAWKRILEIADDQAQCNDR